MVTVDPARGAAPPKRKHLLLRMLAIVGLVVLGGLVFILSQVEVRSGEPEPPPRPPGVPEKAVWYGGLDGGRFYLLRPAPADGTYSLKVYNDWSGDLEFNGELRLDEPSRAPIRLNDAKTFADWNGSRLRLTDGRTLSRVRKPKPPK